MPEVWWLSRICEEFHCLPSEALREWRRQPLGLLEQIVEARAYAHAKRLVDRAKSSEDYADVPLAEEVVQIEFALVAAAMKADAENTHTS